MNDFYTRPQSNNFDQKRNAVDELVHTAQTITSVLKQIDGLEDHYCRCIRYCIHLIMLEVYGSSAAHCPSLADGIQ
jgi:hypothetical protein